MQYTISDFYHTFKPGLRLIAGSGGMTRSVSNVAILDYELDPALKNKYFHTNLQENQLALSSFLYARDNPYLIGTAVKHLMEKGCSGLAIKNVFHLPIHDTVIRYADARNFPVFLIEGTDIYFEDVIYRVNRRIEALRSDAFAQKQLDMLMDKSIGPSRILACCRSLNPSLQSYHFMIFSHAASELEVDNRDQIIRRFEDSSLNLPQNLLTSFRGGILFLYSWDGENSPVLSEIAHRFQTEVLESDACLMRIGISSIHYRLEDSPLALRESLQAYHFANKKDSPVFFDNLGSFKLLLDFAQTPQMQRFSREILDSLEEYDAENSAKLTETLAVYCNCDCSIPAAAKALAQHENTIRYRLEKICSVTGLNFRSFNDMKQLSLAWQIKQCADVCCQIAIPSRL